MREIKIAFRVTEAEYNQVMHGRDEMLMLEVFARAFEDGDYSPVMPSTKERLDQHFMIVYEAYEDGYTHMMKWAVSKQECLEDPLLKALGTERLLVLSYEDIERIRRRDYTELGPAEQYVKYNSDYILEA